MQKKLDSTNKYYIGKALIDKNISDWDIISINDTQAIYGTGWNFIKAGTKIEDYGNTNNDWLVNYDTGEIIQLEENKYVEISSKDGLAVTNGLVFNIDSKNMNTSDPTTWGGGVELYNIDRDTGDVISLKGRDEEYIEFQAGDNFKDGFTFSFYGIPRDSGNFFSKQREKNADYSCRFGFGGNKFYFNTSKNRSNSDWAGDDGLNNGILWCPYGTFQRGELVALDVKFEPMQNRFSIYKNGIFQGSTIVDSNYWNGTNGGKKVFEDTSIKCYIGRYYGGAGQWNYVKVDIYSLRLYNRAINDEEISQNYNKNVVYHNLNQ